jgi:histidinol-phosphate aminotransferase
VPAFVIYKLMALLFGATVVEVPMRDFRHDLAAMARAITPRTKLIFVGSPNNPTGAANPAAELLAFARALPEHVVLALDEAYAEYDAQAPDLRPLIAEGRKVIGLKTFSKAYGLAALRVGYGYGSKEMAALLNRVRQPFNVNAIAQAAAVAALDDHEFLARCMRENRMGLEQITAGARALGLECAPSAANFVLIKVGDGIGWFGALQQRGLIVRPLQPYGLPEWIRVTVGTAEQNKRLLLEMATLAKKT